MVEFASQCNGGQNRSEPAADSDGACTERRRKVFFPSGGCNDELSKKVTETSAARYAGRHCRTKEELPADLWRTRRIRRKNRDVLGISVQGGRRLDDGGDNGCEDGRDKDSNANGASR